MKGYQTVLVYVRAEHYARILKKMACVVSAGHQETGAEVDSEDGSG